MNDASLPPSLGKELRGGLNQAAAGIGNNQLYAFETAIFEVPQESTPTLQILLLALSNAQYLPKTVGPDTDRDQHGDIAHLTGPTALEHNAVEIHVWKVTLDRAVAPRFDMPVDLLVQPAHGARAHPRAPKRLS